MLSTSFTRLVGCSAPIQCAPLPSIGVADLVVAVADAGGLGMLGAPLLAPDVLEALTGEIRARTKGAFGVNFLMPFLVDRACVEVAAAKARVVEFFYGEPDPDLVALAHRGGALVSWQIGSRDEAIAAERAGCDLIVAQGMEAGGHVRGRIGLLPILGQVLESVSCPVLAAGGIARPADLAAVLVAGAAGARLGTRFLAAKEAATHPRYLDLLLRASAEDTVYTEAFSVMWPNAPHRVLRSCIAAAERLTDEVMGEIQVPEGRMEVPRFSIIAPTRETTGHVEAMALYAGESVAAVKSVEPAADIVRDLTEGASEILARKRVD
jgi:NAD(P)H-dependent flavin oxidoreductase YrpB (nitropropane dioxygenase family)